MIIITIIIITIIKIITIPVPEKGPSQWK